MNLPLIDDYFVKEGYTVVQEACILEEKMTGCLPAIGVLREQGIDVFIVLYIVIEKVGQKFR